jgi:hypothetical protein
MGLSPFELRDEHKFRVFVNRNFKRIFDSKREKTMEDELHNEQRHNLYS